MYKDYNDQELLYLVGESSEEATDILYDKYKEKVSIKVKKYISYAKKMGLEYNDLFQEGMVGLSKAIKSYSEQKDTIFSTFANLCIDRQIFSALAKARRKKHEFLNESLSLDFVIDDDGKTLLDCLFDSGSDPSLKLENDEKRKALYENLDNELTSLEKSVFDLKVAGFEYKEISKILNKSYKSIDSTLQRIRIKVKKLLDKYE
jgi:RNA polymerase sporulation-specific sigma factor